jgi:predicted nucleic acid-binding protein
MATPRVVLDTHLWLEMLVFHDSRAFILRDALRGSSDVLHVAMNHFTLSELHSTLRRNWPHEVWRVRAVNVSPTIHAQTEAIEGLSLLWLNDNDTAAALTLPALPKCRDPNDVPLFALASAADAAMLISRDKAVLKCRSYAHVSGTGRGVTLTPEAAVERLRA